MKEEPKGMANWTAMVAAHAAVHVAAGVDLVEAIHRGMLDYSAQLDRLGGLVGYGVRYRNQARADALHHELSKRIQDEVKKDHQKG